MTPSDCGLDPWPADEAPVLLRFYEEQSAGKEKKEKQPKKDKKEKKEKGDKKVRLGYGP
jgi:hypothetical protein